MSTAATGTADLAYPELFSATDTVAAQHQRRFYAAKALELGSLGLGSLFGLFDRDALAGTAPMVTVGMFLVALALQVSRVASVAERRWYDARAAAESIKSAAWQFAVGGEAFRLDMEGAESAFAQRLADALLNVPHLDVGATTSTGACATAGMLQLRASPQSERYARYRSGRIDEQVGWYARKAHWNKVRARVWGGATIIVEGTAVVVGLLRVNGSVQVDLLGLFGTTAAGLVAWAQAKNYTQLSESYAVTSHEVVLVAQSVHDSVSEPEWAQSVHDAEAAFSREHTMWVARRQGPQRRSR